MSLVHCGIFICKWMFCLIKSQTCSIIVKSVCEDWHVDLIHFISPPHRVCPDDDSKVKTGNQKEHNRPNSGQHSHCQPSTSIHNPISYSSPFSFALLHFPLVWSVLWSACFSNTISCQLFPYIIWFSLEENMTSTTKFKSCIYDGDDNSSVTHVSIF